LYDFTDVPVTPSYVKAVESITENNRAVSRWFNAMCCNATEAQQAQLRQLSFVRDVKVVNHQLRLQVAEFDRFDAHNPDADSYVPSADEVLFLNAQIERMGASVFATKRIDGKGVRVAIFDVGFKSYNTNPAFEHIRKSNRIIKTYDFATNKEDVDHGGSHGTYVMSCVGGRIGKQNIGLATGAEFLLARTERRTEYFSEEENWLEAAEWADQNGAHIINSSLGYTYHRYFKEDMDGQQSLVARAANMAAKKGILVVNSAGNEGSGNWKSIGTPADADSVLSIGGINPNTGVHTSFSSFGPTWDKRLKPNVTAYGHVIGSGPRGLDETQGTSFSGPLVAGFAACAKQAAPTYKNMKLYGAIEKSSDLYPYFDYAHGYGVPQAKYFFKAPIPVEKQFSFERKNDRIYIRINDITSSNLSSLDSGASLIGQRYIAWPDYIFYHIENKKGYLDSYFVVNPYSKFSKTIEQMAGDGSKPLRGEGPLVVRKSEYAKPFTLRVYYRGYVDEIIIK
jgi:serine protease AprX